MALNLRPKLSDVLERHTGKLIRNFGVATPGIVTRAHTSGGVTYAVDAQPAINRLVPSEDDEDIDVSERPAAVQYVPVVWLVGRGIKVKATLAPGDTVLLVCMDRDISAWRATGAVSDPDDARLHDYGSCVAIPGLVPDTSSFPEPADAAALASRLDKVIKLLTNWVPVSADGGAALQAAAKSAFPNWAAGYGSFPPAPAPGGELTSGSDVLKLEE